MRWACEGLPGTVEPVPGARQNCSPWPSLGVCERASRVTVGRGLAAESWGPGWEPGQLIVCSVHGCPTPGSLLGPKPPCEAAFNWAPSSNVIEPKGHRSVPAKASVQVACQGPTDRWGRHLGCSWNLLECSGQFCLWC